MVEAELAGEGTDGSDLAVQQPPGPAAGISDESDEALVWLRKK